MKGARQITKKPDVQTVETVVKRGLCTGCGTCVSMCPTKAISIAVDARLGIYLPKIDSSKCGSCHLCYNVCPGEAVNFKELSKNPSPQQETAKPNIVLLGNYLNCYVGFATDNTVRIDSSSGGLITQLLVFALEEGLIDGALVTRMNKNNPLEPEPFIARTTAEILEASKSKYCPVPANVVLKQILENEGRYAVVGLPCHIHGLRKAQALNKKLRDRVVFSIAIFCSHCDNFIQTQFILQRLNINAGDVKQLDYRGKGWPGKLTVQLKSGQIKETPYEEYIKLHECGFFAPDRCLVCCDHVGELSDFSCGDAWLPEYLNDKDGTSLVISRNIESERILQLAVSKGNLRLEPISADEVVKSQGNMRFKKNSYGVRAFLFRLSGKSSPYFVTVLPKSRLIDWVRSLMILLNREIAKKKLLNKNIDFLLYCQLRLKKLYLNTIN